MTSLPPGRSGFRDAGLSTVRGLTIGPIESRVQPGRGYGSPRFAETLEETSRLGGTWISLTPFGRAWDLDSRGVENSFEAPLAETRENICRSVKQAHADGLRVLLVPHLWIETGRWRAELDPGTEREWAAWAKSYEKFVLSWADLAEECEIDLFAAGVELRSWVTTQHAPTFVPILRRIRDHYHGLVTYAANWDDVGDTLILRELDVIGINAFYPLHWEKNATLQQLAAGGERVASAVDELSRRYDKPVIFTEFGYTTRKDTAIEPWLWPEQLGSVTIDQVAQEDAYAALLGAMTRTEGFAGMFVWRIYADVADLSQEPDWGFSPWGKRSLGVLKDAFRARYAGDVGFRNPSVGAP